jgi:DNA-binding transcriptional ArsR family regulator
MTQMSKKRRSRPAARECCADVAAVVEPRLFKALCDPNRIALLARLAQCGRPCTVGEISRCCPVDLSVVSRHLAILRDAGVLESHKKGKEVFYAVRFNPIATTLRSIADAIEACCPRRKPQQKER